MVFFTLILFIFLCKRGSWKWSQLQLQFHWLFWCVKYIKRSISRSSNTRRLYTVIHFVWVIAKFGTVVSLNVTLVEDKKRRFKGDESAHFSFNKYPIYTHDGASAKFSTNSCETDDSVLLPFILFIFLYLPGLQLYKRKRRTWLCL